MLKSLMGARDPGGQVDAQRSVQLPLTGSSGRYLNPVHKLFRNVPFPTQEGHSFSNTTTASYTPGTPNHTVIAAALQIDPTEMVADPCLTWIRDAVSSVA